MKFQLAVNMERIDESYDMKDVARHTLEMVQIADEGGFDIVWSAEHHALEMTIAPNPFQLLTWWSKETSNIRLGTGSMLDPDAPHHAVHHRRNLGPKATTKNVNPHRLANLHNG
mgnify:CR=1 FL=1